MRATSGGLPFAKSAKGGLFFFTLLADGGESVCNLWLLSRPPGVLPSRCVCAAHAHPSRLQRVLHPPCDSVGDERTWTHDEIVDGVSILQKAGVGTFPQAVSTGRFFVASTLRL